jgi:putative phosphoesterase
MPTWSSIGAIGDIHAEDTRLEIVLQFFADQQVEKVLAVGDLVDGPGDPLRVCSLLEQHSVEVVAGNHDRWLLENPARSTLETQAQQDRMRAFLEPLPPTRRYETPAGPLLLCHGMGDNDMNGVTVDDYGYGLENNDELQELLRTKEYRYVICGHTHRRMVRDFGGLTVINAGTLLGPHDPCIALCNFSEASVRFYSITPGGDIVESTRHEL